MRDPMDARECRKKYNLDASHIGTFGASAGGHLALLLSTMSDNPGFEGAVGDYLNFSRCVQCVCP